MIFNTFQPFGIDNIQLNANVSTIRNIIPIQKKELAQYTFSPDDRDFFKIKNVDKNRASSLFNIEDIFIACDSAKDIKRIFIFLVSDKEEIVKYFESLLAVHNLQGISHKDGIRNTTAFIWNTNVKTTISLFDISSLYQQKNLFVVDFTNAGDLETLKKYKVVKRLNLK